MGTGIAVLVSLLFKEGSGAPPAWGSWSKAIELRLGPSSPHLQTG